MYAELKRTKNKFCKVCKRYKQWADYYKDCRRPDGHAYECKSCKKKEEAKSRINNPERWKRKRHRNLLAEKFGITIHDYDDILIKQKNSCAICGKHQSVLKKRLFVDHCHKTSKVRGLLCQKCNFAIGLLEESELILKKAISYLKKFKK